MLRFLPLALLSTLVLTCSSLPPEVPIPKDIPTTAGRTEDSHNVVVYPTEYLDNTLTKIDTATTEEGLFGVLTFKDMRPEYIPNVGDIIASPVAEKAPDGFLYKVLAVSTKDGVTAVAARGATLEEAVEEADFKSETDFEFDEDGNLLKMLQKSTSAGLNLTREIPFGNNKTLTADVSYTITFVFDINIKWYKIKSTKMSIKQNGRTAIRGSVKEKIDKTIEKEIGKVHLPNITFLIGPIPVVVANDLSFSLKMAGNAETDLTASYTINGSGEYGFEYSGGRFSKIADNSFESSFDYEQSVSGDIRVGADANLETKLYGVAGLVLGAGPALKLSVEGKPVGVYVFENGFKNSANNGASLDLGLDFSAKITLGMLGFNLKYTFAESWATIKPLYKASFLPLFDDPQVSVGGSGVAVRSGLRRDKLNYPVKAFGFCVEGIKGDCKSGKGERKSLAESLRAGEYREISVSFSNVEYENYNIVPYFENGVGGTYYDRAVNVVGVVVKSSSSGFGSSSSSFSSSSSSGDSGQFSPCVQGSVVVGNQVWQKCNLNVVPTSENGMATNSKCYGNAPTNCDIYGRLYDWATAMALPDSCNKKDCTSQINAKHQGICPSGWHIPSIADWDTLMTTVGGSSIAGWKLKTISGWNKNGNGTDEYGFSALPGGGCFSPGGDCSGDDFDLVGINGHWWSANEKGSLFAHLRIIGYNAIYVDYLNDSGKIYLFSVRCLQD